MVGYPVGYRLMCNFQMASTLAQVHAIHIHFHSSLVHTFWVTLCFGFGCVLALAVHTTIPLGTCLRFSRFILAGRFLTVRASFHSSILAHPFGHSQVRLERFFKTPRHYYCIIYSS